MSGVGETDRFPFVKEASYRMNRQFFLCICTLFPATMLFANQQCDDLIKLAKSGVGEEVIVAYINSTDASFNLSPDDISKLKAAGVPPKVIIMAIRHYRPKSPDGPAVQSAASEPVPAIAPPPCVVVTRPGPWQFRRYVDTAYTHRVAKMDQAFQIDIFAPLLNTFSANYEFLLAHRYGIVAEGSYYDNGSDSHGENVELGYRYHLSGSMNSGFLGIFLKGTRIYGNDRNPFSPVDYTFTGVTVGPSIGKRWVSISGLNFVGRIGYGFTWTQYDNALPDRHTREELRNGASFDAELSIGYAF